MAFIVLNFDNIPDECPVQQKCALEMCGRQRQLGMVGEELERRGQEICDLQARLQDAEKILVRLELTSLSM